MTVIATAGHVDHGKSTLVKSLTGTDPDRLEEEKARGLTIDLGFAHCVLPSGRGLSLVDVPGHIRFLRNMLAGVGAVDACLFVVAATEGWKPQSEEHLQILELLGISRGVVALTKVDQVDEELLELALLDLEEHVVDSFLADAPVIQVAAIEGTDGTGMHELRLALDDMIADLEAADARDEADEPVADKGEAGGAEITSGPHRTTPRLWVDRAFAPTGAGTVVTGTLTGAPLAVGDELTLIGNRQEHQVRVRGLQTHYAEVETISPAARVAVNLVGVGHNEVQRGHVLVDGSRWHRTSQSDAELTVLPGLAHPVSRRGAYVAYIGAAEVPLRMRVLGESEIAPGSSGAVRLYLGRPLPLVPGDRFVLRESGRHETVGGGQILDVDPVVPAASAHPDMSVARVVAERGWVEVDHLARLTGRTVTATVGNWVVDPDKLEQTVATLTADIEEAGALGLDVAALNDQQRAALTVVEGIRVENGRATIGPIVDPLADHPWVKELAADPFSPPGPGDVPRDEVRQLVRRDLIIESDGIYFAQSALTEARRLVANALDGQPDGLTVAEIRDLLGTTRKYALALLSYMDGNGMTRRRDDLRIAGPRL